jgi:hypothetical protein
MPGVGDAHLFDAHLRDARVAQARRDGRLGITTSDVAAAIRVQNAQNAAGKIGAEPVLNGQQLTYTVTAKGRLLTPEDFGNIVLRAEGPNGLVRLKDVARIELGADNYDRTTKRQRLPGVRAWASTCSRAPTRCRPPSWCEPSSTSCRSVPGRAWNTSSPTTPRASSGSIKEVVKTLARSHRAGDAVVYLFLQNWRATLIPLMAVPVSLIGTFAGMWLFGFSINTLTLFAMVLAIGIVVDDAIVVLENVERLMRGRCRRRRRLPSRPCAKCRARWSPSCWCWSRCSCRWPSWAALPASSTAVRRDRGRGGGDLGHRRADVDAGPVRPAAEGTHEGEAPSSVPSTAVSMRFTRGCIPGPSA